MNNKPCRAAPVGTYFKTCGKSHKLNYCRKNHPGSPAPNNQTQVRRHVFLPLHSQTNMDAQVKTLFQKRARMTLKQDPKQDMSTSSIISADTYAGIRSKLLSTIRNAETHDADHPGDAHTQTIFELLHESLEHHVYMTEILGDLISDGFLPAHRE